MFPLAEKLWADFALAVAEVARSHLLEHHQPELRRRKRTLEPMPSKAVSWVVLLWITAMQGFLHLARIEQHP
jgi:hypothetical protein